MRGCRFVLLLICALGLAGCSGDDAGDKPYVEFSGGGFVFNYRLGTADYGFVAQVVRHIPSGTVLEANFDDPAGGAPIVVRQVAAGKRLYYVFRTPPVEGIKAGHDYHVRLRMTDPATGKLLASYDHAFHADLDQSVLPNAPLTYGPGYQNTPVDGPEPAVGGNSN